MKKTILLPLLLLLALCLPACSGAGDRPADETTAAGAAETDERIQLPDFTVETADGGSFTLSRALEEKGTALINLWATWCGYCTVEFPYLQEAYAQHQNDAAVICLSVEPQDTPEAIRAYAETNGLTLPMGSAVGTGLERYANEGVPVTITVDRNRYITAMHLGALTSAESFTELLRTDGTTAGTCVYTVYFADVNGSPLPGCAVSFCAGDVCVPVFADETGAAVYEGAPGNYTVKLISAPEGYRAADGEEQTAGPYSQTLTFYLQKETP